MMALTTLITNTVVVVAILSASPASTTETTIAPPATTNRYVPLEIAQAFNKNYKTFEKSVSELMQANTDLMDGHFVTQKAFTRVSMNELKKENSAYVKDKAAERIDDTRRAVAEIQKDLQLSIDLYAMGVKEKLTAYINRKLAALTIDMNASNNRTAVKIYNLNVTCPYGWSELTTKCVIEVMNKWRTWEGANRDCAQYGRNGRLVEIDNTIENYYIREMLRNQVDGSGYERTCYWIGIGDVNGNNQFTTSSGKKAKYLRWKYGQPNEGTRTKKCACLGYQWSTYWVDMHCSSHYTYVCQIDKLPAAVQAKYKKFIQ